LDSAGIALEKPPALTGDLRLGGFVEGTESKISMMPYYPARDGHPSMFTLDDNATTATVGPVHSTFFKWLNSKVGAWTD
jgi:hypothetical protein